MILKHLYDLQEHDAFIYDGCLFVFDCVSVVDADECFAVNMASHCLVILPSSTVVDVISPFFPHRFFFFLFIIQYEFIKVIFIIFVFLTF